MRDELNLKFNTNIPEILHKGEVADPEKWEKDGRARLKEILQREEYGRFPEYDKKNTTFNVKKCDKVLNRPMIHKTVDITINYNGRSYTFTTHLHLPEGKKNVPVFVFINRDEWMVNRIQNGVINEWFPLDEIIRRGYGVANFCTEQIAHDNQEDKLDYQTGLFRVLGIDMNDKDELATIGLWSFATMRIMDYLETDPDVDATKVAVLGHSRLGKTALVTGAFDERFALTISNSSGCGGAALFKTKIGEHVDFMIEHIPFWFCQNYRKYAANENAMEFDQHYLLSLIAPRALYVQSSELDDWADPNAEFASAVLASEVYEKVYGISGLIQSGFPAVDSPLHEGNIGYHVRTGGHLLTKYDWEKYMDFADKIFGK